MTYSSFMEKDASCNGLADVIDSNISSPYSDFLDRCVRVLTYSSLDYPVFCLLDR
jgi:hypothetical protein